MQSRKFQHPTPNNGRDNSFVVNQNNYENKYNNNNSNVVEYLETLIEYHQQQLQKHKALEMINTIEQENKSRFLRQKNLSVGTPIKGFGVPQLPVQNQSSSIGVPAPNQKLGPIQILNQNQNQGFTNVRSSQLENLVQGARVNSKGGQVFGARDNISPRSHFQAVFSDSESVISQEQSEKINGNLSTQKNLLSQHGGSMSVSALPKASPAAPQGEAQQKYKTEICKLWEETGWCRFGEKCHFAHGKVEVKSLARHPKYKTKVCRNFSETGMCHYGNRCQFLHQQQPVTPADIPKPNNVGVSQHRLPIFQMLAAQQPTSM